MQRKQATYSKRYQHLSETERAAFIAERALVRLQERVAKYTEMLRHDKERIAYLSELATRVVNGERMSDVARDVEMQRANLHAELKQFLGE